MHAPIKYFEKGLSVAANGAWMVFNGLNKISQKPSFTPKWSDKPLLKSYQKTKPPLGWPRETDSLCPTCVREARQEILDGKKDVSILLNEKVGEIKATILERDGKILMVKDCPIHGHFEDVMAMDTGVLQAPRRGVPGPRHPRAQRREAAQPRQQHDQARPRLGADGRPDEPLQHDVRPVLHGREPGRVRPRADVGRHQDGARQRDHHQAAAADVGAVLRRRADDFARTSSTRCATRARSATTACRRRPTASSSPRIRSSPRRRPKPACATPTCSLTASATPPTRIAASATCSTSSCARSRTCTRAGVDIVPVITIVNGVNNEQVGRVIEFALDNPKKINFLSFQPVSLHRPRRGDHRRAAPGAALHAVAPGARREEPDRPRRADPRLVPDLVHGHLHRLGGRRPRTGRAVGPAHLRLPPELRHRHGDDDRQGNQGSGAGDGVPQRRAARQGRRAGQRRRAAASSCRCSA